MTLLEYELWAVFSAFGEQDKRVNDYYHTYIKWHNLPNEVRIWINKAAKWYLQGDN